jgi:glycine cleavage system H protein
MPAATAMTTPAEPAPQASAASPATGPVPAICVHLSPGHANTWRQHIPIRETMSDIPAGRRYSTDHRRARPGAGELVRAGVTGFAQQSPGDVVDGSPPKPGDTVTAGQACGDIEPVNSVSDLIAPVTGTARTRNEDLAETPDPASTGPYGQGRLLEAQTDPAAPGQQLAALIDAGACQGPAGP